MPTKQHHSNLQINQPNTLGHKNTVHTLYSSIHTQVNLKLDYTTRLCCCYHYPHNYEFANICGFSSFVSLRLRLFCLIFLFTNHLSTVSTLANTTSTSRHCRHIRHSLPNPRQPTIHLLRTLGTQCQEHHLFRSRVSSCSIFIINVKSNQDSLVRVRPFTIREAAQM